MQPAGFGKDYIGSAITFEMRFCFVISSGVYPGSGRGSYNYNARKSSMSSKSLLYTAVER